jgi:hypothetical protein
MSACPKDEIVRAEARIAAADAKLSPYLRQLIEHLPLSQICEEWATWDRGLTPDGYQRTFLEDNTHGVTHFRGGNFAGIEINQADPQRRQLVTVAHEAIHKYGRVSDEPDIHGLAYILARMVFPSVGGNMNIFDRDPQEAIGYDESLEEAALTDEELEQIALTDLSPSLQPFGLTQDADYFAKKKSFISKLVRAPGQLVKKLIRGGGKHKSVRQQVPVPASDADVIMSNFRGWAAEPVVRMFGAGALIMPARGIYRAAPIHNIAGFKAPTVRTFWSQLMETLNAGAGRAAKEEVRATAVAGVATVATISANTRSIGAIVRLSDSFQAGDNRAVRVRHWTGAGQTELEYLMGFELERGVAEWLILHVENERGGGLPLAAVSLQVTINADGIRPGAILSVESLNLRDIQR